LKRFKTETPFKNHFTEWNTSKENWTITNEFLWRNCPMQLSLHKVNHNREKQDIQSL
jgi:hypothetical protein